MKNVLALVAMSVVVLAGGCGSDEDDGYGGRCTSERDCRPGLACETSVPGGYCTGLCRDTADCLGGGALCDALPGTPNVCLRICTDHADCRDDQACNGVTGTNMKACRPKS